MEDLTLIKYGFGVMISYVTIKSLFQVVIMLIKKRNDNGKNYIRTTGEFVERIEQVFWEGKEQMGDIHEIVTAKTNGIPLIYNQELQTCINKLNNNLENLTNAIKDLRDNCARKLN